MKNEKGKIITITSSKGGVGKSIFLLNLAGIYQKLGKKVLLLDFDLSGGSIALCLNIPVKKTIYNAIEDLQYNRYEKLEEYTVSYTESIDVISSPKDPRQAMKLEIRYLSVFFEKIRPLYDVILVDTTHGFSKNNIVLFDQSDMLLYMVTNDFTDLKNTKNFMTIMKDVEMDNVKVILNNSIGNKEEYFSNFDIRTMIHWNIDYTISSTLHIKNITKYLLEGKIFTLDNSNDKKYQKEEKKLNLLAKELLGEE